MATFMKDHRLVVTTEYETKYEKNEKHYNIRNLRTNEIVRQRSKQMVSQFNILQVVFDVFD